MWRRKRLENGAWLKGQVRTLEPWPASADLSLRFADGEHLLASAVSTECHGASQHVSAPRARLRGASAAIHCQRGAEECGGQVQCVTVDHPAGPGLSCHHIRGFPPSLLGQKQCMLGRAACWKRITTLDPFSPKSCTDGHSGKQGKSGWVLKQ